MVDHYYGIQAYRPIKLKLFDPSIPAPDYAHGKEKSDWLDLRSRTTVELKKGDYFEICLNVAMELPPGYEAWIVPRSSTYKQYGLIPTTSMSVIDHSYCGDEDEWHFPVIACRDTIIHKGDRICQFRIHQNQYPLVFNIVDKLYNPSRGSFGTTGRQP